MSKREAMVVPAPGKADKELTPAQAMRLIHLLELIGNDRAYTLIWSRANSFKVFFEGDDKPTTIRLVNGKPVIER